MTDQPKTSAWPSAESVAKAMVDGSAELSNGDIKWGELSDFARREWVKKAEIALTVIGWSVNGKQ